MPPTTTTTRVRSLTFSILVTCAAAPVACADEFSSCEDTLTCEPQGGASGSAGDVGAGAGGTIAEAGNGGDSPGGIGATSGAGATGGGEGPTDGEECVEEGATLCSEVDDTALLRCTDGAWELGTCDAGFVCASEPAVCTPVAEGCEERVPGEAFCADDVLRVCGPDRTTATEQACEGRCFVDRCLPVGCGDGLVRDGEACDDGNDVAGDGCSGCQWDPAGIKAMGQHTCAWFVDGSLKCWGRNDTGQLGLGDTADRGDSASELWRSLPNVPLQDVTAVAGSLYSTCAVAAGEIYCWGSNEFGELGSETPGIATQPVKVPLRSGQTFTDIQASRDGTYCAVPSNGPLLCWGKNDVAQTGRGLGVAASMEYANIGDSADEILLSPSGPSISSVTSLSLGLDYGCAIAGTALRCWGGQSLNLGTSNTGVFGDDPAETLPPPLSLGSGFVPRSIAAGAGSPNGCVLSTMGDVKCWGTSVFGQTALGYGDTTSVSASSLAMQPVIDLGAPVIQLAAARLFTCALLENGAVKCWGRPPGVADLLGDDAEEMGDNLPAVELLFGARQISAGLDHACAVLDNSEVHCWGTNHHGQLGVGRRGPTPPCPTYRADLAFDPSGTLAGTCCITEEGRHGAMQVVRAVYQACRAGVTPTRE